MADQGMVRFWWWAVWTIAGTLLLAGQAWAQLGSDPVRVDHAWSAQQARPGDQRVLAVVIDLDERWHINPDAARTAEDLIPTEVTVISAAPGLQVGPVQFPEPTQVVVNYTGEPESIAAYEGRVVLYVPVVVAADVAAGAAPLELAVRYQACDDRMCLPPRTAKVAATLAIDEASIATEQDAELFGGFDPAVFAAMLAGDTVTQLVAFDIFSYRFSLDPRGVGLVLLLGVAAVGGMLLNFTPCVLPVIPIKIMSLSHAAGTRGRCFGLGLAMAAGVVAFWLGLGVAIATVAGFDAINELFQRVWFTIGVGVIIAVMAVAMTGLFTIQLPRTVYQFSPRNDTLIGSFGLGIMTAVLSTPCTAPFMGAAAAWATTQPQTVTLATFGSIGGGMALPYLVLAAMPTLVQRIPRTGPGSELIKQAMGLLMLAAAAYFIGVGVSTLTVTPPDSPSDAYWWPVVGLIAAAGAWVAYRTFVITRDPGKRIAFAGAGAATIVAAGFLGVRLTDDGPIPWVNYTPERFAAAVDDGRVVVMDFTAEWCLNCKALEHSVLYTDRVASLFDDPEVLPMKVDITSDDNVDGMAKLREAGRVTIPLLVVYGRDGREVFKSDAYTVNQVVEAVQAAKTAALTRR